MRKATYTEVGRAGTDKEFTDAFNKVAGMRTWSRGNAAGKNLMEGALEAFNEGRPEHLQQMIVMAQAAKWKGYTNISAADVLGKVYDKSKDKQAALELALEKTTVQQRQKILDLALNNAAAYDQSPKFIAALFTAGAKMTADASGRTTLAAAIINSAPQEVIKALYEHGAKFDDAQIYMLNYGYDARHLEKLKFYKEQFEGASAPTQAPAAIAAGPSVEEEVLVRVLQAMQRLEQKVDALTEEVAGLKAAEAAPQEKPARKSYPSLGKR